MAVKKIAVLFSGNGTNLANIIKTLHEPKKVEIVVAISNKTNAKGLEIAKRANIKTEIIEHKNFKNREDFDGTLVKIIKSYRPDLCVLAGFMRILTPIFTSQIKAINLHPSLLPLFKGANAIEKSFYSGMSKGGVSIHFVEQELDGGSVIAQTECEIQENDTLESFSKKIHDLEYNLLPETILSTLYGDTNE